MDLFKFYAVSLALCPGNTSQKNRLQTTETIYLRNAFLLMVKSIWTGILKCKFKNGEIEPFIETSLLLLPQQYEGRYYTIFTQVKLAAAK